MTGSLRQLRALLALRWQMARTAGVRLTLVLTAAAVVWLLSLVLGSGSRVDAVALATAIELAPAAYLGFGVLALVAPLTAGGGHDVVPPGQLVAYPVRPTTQFLGGLVLAPANLVWVVQLLGLATLTAWLTIGGSLLHGAVTTAAYVLALTVLGQAVAWLVVGLRQTRRGRQAVAAAVVGLLAAGILVVRSGQGRAALLTGPTHDVVAGVIAGGDGHLLRWGTTTAVLLAVAGLALLLGVRACRWALHRPGDEGAQPAHRPLRRRPVPASPLRALVAVDRASVWRAPALRRGAIVLAVLPGLLAAGAALPWASLVVLPGLVAAGAGLLFGVNAFCLDASGARWLASLPHDPALVLRAKALVLTETVLGTAVLAVAAGALRSPGTPTSAELSAIVASALLCTAVVVSVALKASVRRPHSADLTGPRDAVAPPGALAVASLRLAVPTACVGVLLSAASGTGLWWLPPAFALPLLALCGLSVARTANRWADPHQRARVVDVVSTG